MAKKYLIEMESSQLTFYRFLYAFVITTILMLIQKKFFVFDTYSSIIGVLIGVGYIFYYESLKILKTAQVASLELSSPFFAALTGYLFLSEKINRFQAIGFCFLFFGIICFLFHQKTKKLTLNP